MKPSACRHGKPGAPSGLMPRRRGIYRRERKSREGKLEPQRIMANTDLLPQGSHDYEECSNSRHKPCLLPSWKVQPVFLGWKAGLRWVSQFRPTASPVWWLRAPREKVQEDSRGRAARPLLTQPCRPRVSPPSHSVGQQITKASQDLRGRLLNSTFPGRSS